MGQLWVQLPCLLYLESGHANATRNVCFGPKADSAVQQSRSVLLIKITAKSPNDEAD
jgi:hypothetical protein